MASAQPAISLTTSDGHRLAADVAEPPTDVGVRGGVAICHPHPQYGGNRFNNVVDAVFRALPPARFRAVRFDFRAAHGGGVAERRDLVAALDELASRGDGPLAVVGYSFGASVALNTDDGRIAAIVAIAPPLATMPGPAPAVPTLVLTPRHDQFSAPDTASAIVAGWEQATFEVVESADHFLVGHTATVAARATTWLTERLAR